MGGNEQDGRLDGAARAVDRGQRRGDILRMWGLVRCWGWGGRFPGLRYVERKMQVPLPHTKGAALWVPEPALPLLSVTLLPLVHPLPPRVSGQRGLARALQPAHQGSKVRGWGWGPQGPLSSTPPLHQWGNQSPEGEVQLSAGEWPKHGQTGWVQLPVGPHPSLCRPGSTPSSPWMSTTTPGFSRQFQHHHFQHHRCQPRLHVKSLPFSQLMNMFQTLRAFQTPAKFVLTGVAHLQEAGAPLISLRFEVPRSPLISARFEIWAF